MNRKTLKKVLDKKHKEFIASIEDIEVRKLVDKNSIITGGAIASGLLNEKINDFDYYFTNKETCIAVCEYYAAKFVKLNPDSRIGLTIKTEGDRVRIDLDSPSDELRAVTEGGEDHGAIVDSSRADFDPVELDAEQTIAEFDDVNAEDLDDGKGLYRPIFLTGNAITLSNKVQLITRFYGEPEEIHKNYDFIHCTNYWLSSDRKLYLNQDALESLLCRDLRYVGSLYPVSSVIRTRKFIKRGWHINAGQYIKMVFQISQIDLTDLEVLEDQLVGVDCTYFAQVIDRLQDKRLKDPDFTLDTTYLVSVIDKIF